VFVGSNYVLKKLVKVKITDNWIKSTIVRTYYSVRLMQHIVRSIIIEYKGYIISSEYTWNREVMPTNEVGTLNFTTNKLTVS